MWRLFTTKFRSIFAVIFFLSSYGKLLAGDSVTFNEIMFHPAQNEAEEEWIELHNQFASNIDISGWKIAGGAGFTFPEGTRIVGNGYLLIASSPQRLRTLTGLTNIFGPFTNRLSNAGEKLELRNNSDRLMDALDYQAADPWPVGPDGSGASLARIKPGISGKNPNNWRSSRNLGGTPGRENFPATPNTHEISLAFNEIQFLTNRFKLELINHGSNSITLNDLILVHQGNVDHRKPLKIQNLPADGFISLSELDLGYIPLLGEKLFLVSTNQQILLDALVIPDRLSARHPDGTGTWFFPASPTFGGSNLFQFRTEIVINEVMFAPVSADAASGGLAIDREQAWLEIFNRSSNTVSLTGWKIRGGIDFEFPPGTALLPVSYLVVCKNHAKFREENPGVQAIGNFSGNLSRNTDSVQLMDDVGNPVSKLEYFNGGRWPKISDAEGSSLELHNPDAPTEIAESWAASVEPPDADWTNIVYRGIAGSQSFHPSQWNEFVLGLLSAGECLIDDLRVVQTSVPGEWVENGDFEKGATSWRILGNHRTSTVIPEPGNPTNHVLHLRATGPTEHMHNHLEITLANNQPVSNGQAYEISYRAKWLNGGNRLNTRLYFNRLAKSISLPVKKGGGTPGKKNSQWMENTGPALNEISQHPAVPKPGEPVVVKARVHDASGVAGCKVWWTVNQVQWNSSPATISSTGEIVATIPGLAEGSLVQYYLEATDALENVSQYPATGKNSRMLYRVAAQSGNTTPAHAMRILMTPREVALLHAPTNVMGNGTYECTVIEDESRIYHQVEIRLKGSQRGRNQSQRVSFHLEFPSHDLFRGVHPVMLVDRSGGLRFGRTYGQDEILIKHMINHAGNIPQPETEICHLIAPRSAQNGPALLFPRYEDEFIESQFENGGDGDLYELELIYAPQTTTTGTPTGLKLPEPDGVSGTDFRDLGGDPENYRHPFMKKNHRNADDFSLLMTFAQTLSLTGQELAARSTQVMDVDQWMRAFAMVALCGVSDTYTFGNDHNLMMYVRPGDNRMIALPWDLDFAFTQSETAPLYGGENLQKIILIPANLRRYYGHQLDLIQTTYNRNYMDFWARHYQEFAPGQDFISILSYIQNRGNFVKSRLAPAAAIPFNVTSSRVEVLSQNLAAISGTAPLGVHEITINGKQFPITWSSITNWSIQVPLQSGPNSLSMEALDSRGLTVTNGSKDLLINWTGISRNPKDFLVFNEIGIPGLFPGFVEIFNSSTNFTFDLSAFEIRGLDFQFEPGTFVKPQAYLILAEDPGLFYQKHPNIQQQVLKFAGKLKPEGESLQLLDSSNAKNLVAEAFYKTEIPWPQEPILTGASLQLLDPSQTQTRIGNWTSSKQSDWQFVSVTGTSSNPLLYIYLDSIGEVLLDDIALVEGAVAGVGLNRIRNGDFETPLPGAWNLSPNLAGSQISTNASYAGNGSLRMVSTSPGTTQASSIWQDLAPLPSGLTHTLSFWYRPVSIGARLTLRLSGNGIAVSRRLEEAVSATPGLPNSEQGTWPLIPEIWVNEILSLNQTGITNAAGLRGPWIEIFNRSADPVSLKGYYLSDDFNHLLKWPFPETALIPPKTAMLIQSGPEGSTVWPPYFNFGTNGGGISVSRMRNGNAQVIDYLKFPTLSPDQSYGRFPDGAPNLQYFNRPTPGETNVVSSESITLKINEWMASNTKTITNTLNQNKMDDWFEIYNPGPAAVDLGGFFMTDEYPTSRQLISIPKNTLISPRGFLLVWADKRTDLNTGELGVLHADFQLSKDGDSIFILDPAGRLLDSVTFATQISDRSEGRMVDGAASTGRLPTPTPGFSNSESQNQPPMISPLTWRAAVPGETLWIQVQATDPENQLLSYSIQGSVPDVSINSEGRIHWKISSNQAAGTNVFHVTVRDNGNPPLSDSEDLVVVVGAPAWWNSVQITAENSVLLRANVTPGKRYLVQSKENLNGLEWTTVKDWTAPTSELNFEISIEPTITQRFYRIIEVP